ncbi:MAG: hypothetical protein J3K34DRAFT_444805 [Monoraphidium minutum]|nr:MAG: hypothetical protein J3K34DRAFT_444805 [Monoraphidium minutum]
MSGCARWTFGVIFRAYATLLLHRASGRSASGHRGSGRTWKRWGQGGGEGGGGPGCCRPSRAAPVWKPTPEHKEGGPRDIGRAASAGHKYVSRASERGIRLGGPRGLALREQAQPSARGRSRLGAEGCAWRRPGS